MMSFERLIDFCAMLNRRWNEVLSTGKGIYFLSSAKFRQTSNLRGLLNLLKVHQLSPYSSLASSSRLSLKRIWLPSAEEYFLRILHRAMKKLLSWLFYPVGCGSTTKIVYILKIYTTWIATNIKYHIRLLLTLLPYKHNIVVN